MWTPWSKAGCLKVLRNARFAEYLLKSKLSGRLQNWKLAKEWVVGRREKNTKYSNSPVLHKKWLNTNICIIAHITLKLRIFFFLLRNNHRLNIFNGLKCVLRITHISEFKSRQHEKNGLTFHTESSLHTLLYSVW